jgi:hypothetical protein
MKLCFIIPVVAFLSLTGPAEARKKKALEPVALTESGEAHLQEYTAKLDELKNEVIKALPKLNEGKLTVYQKAREAEVAAVAERARCRKGSHQISEWKRHIGDFNTKWIPMSEKALKEAKEALKTAKGKEAAQAAVEKAEKSLEKTKKGLQQRHDNLKRDLAVYPNVEALLKKAEIAQPKAEAAALAAAKDLGLGKTLASDKLDHKLAVCHIMGHATPRGLAVYAQQGSAQKQRIDELLANGDLLVNMAIADGAQDGNYGKAMEILQAIHASSSKSKSDPTLKNLALGVALELATPRELRNTVADTKAPKFVDPVKRYLAYEKAFLGKELDPCFDNLSVWEMRMVVNGEEPDHIAAWGRQMLANYRPDHILTSDERWRYVDLVRTDIRYGSQDNKFDQDELQFFQNILKNGGICGRRAFIGRYILRSFGVPVTGRPQPGHAALAHYTSDGWVVCLGAGWGKGGTHSPYRKDTDFLASTHSRALAEDYKQIARAQWIGSAHGETRHYGFESHPREEIPFWNALALYKQRYLISKSEAKTLAAVGEDIGEANVTKEKVEIIKVKLSDKDREVKVASNGIITIPAAATSNLNESTEKVIFMPSNQGGLQLHYSRVRDPQPLEYTFEVPKAGKYTLTAKVCSPSWKQNLMISPNGSEKPVKLELPHTVGMWETTAPVMIELKAGKNVLTINHQTDGYAKGFSIHQFKLTPQ